MPEVDLSSWAQHLKHPLVLAGFAILIGAGVISVLFKKDIFHLSRAASERVIKKGLNYAFLLGVLVIVLALWATIPRQPTGDAPTGTPPGVAQRPQAPGPDIPRGDAKQDSGSDGKQESATGVKQESHGDQSPNVVGRDVQIDYRGKGK